HSEFTESQRVQRLRLIRANYIKDKNARLGRFPEYRGKAATTVYVDRHLTLNNDNILGRN
ncbi:MAG TPA: hypothetical protein DDW75_00805, partial [Alteromonas australica]|nr:hypothetical protein [Alteromonas australica]